MVHGRLATFVLFRAEVSIPKERAGLGFPLPDRSQEEQMILGIREKKQGIELSKSKLPSEDFLRTIVWCRAVVDSHPLKQCPPGRWSDNPRRVDGPIIHGGVPGEIEFYNIYMPPYVFLTP